MQFEKIVGQNAIKNRLIQSVKENRISHAQLFTGKEGVGALPLALAYLQMIFCENPTENDSCGVCSSCVKIQKASHPDIHFVFPYAKSKTEDNFNHHIAAFKEAMLHNTYLTKSDWEEHLGVENKILSIYTNDSDELNRVLALKSYEGKYKVAVIWLADNMNTTTANKLLKILEEPYPQTLFILIAESADKLLPTIISRTQNIQIPAISDADMKFALQKNYQLSSEAIDTIVALCEGNWNEAQKMSSGGFKNEYLQFFINWMRQLWKFEVTEIMLLMDSFVALGREGQKNMFLYCLHLVRECLLMNYSEAQTGRANPEELVFLKKFFLYINDNNVMDISKEFNEAIFHVERNANPKILFIDLSAKLAKLLRQKSQ